MQRQQTWEHMGISYIELLIFLCLLVSILSARKYVYLSYWFAYECGVRIEWNTPIYQSIDVPADPWGAPLTGGSHALLDSG